MAKIKFKANTCFEGKIHKKDSVVDLPAKHANFLVDNDHAEDHMERAPQQQQQQQQPPPPAPLKAPEATTEPAKKETAK